MLFQLFNVFNARSDERGAFAGLFSNKWLWGAVLLSLVLQVAVIYIPFLQQAFVTESLSIGDWLGCAAVASSVLWLRELSKVAAPEVHRVSRALHLQGQRSDSASPSGRPYTPSRTISVARESERPTWANHSLCVDPVSWPAFPSRVFKMVYGCINLLFCSAVRSPRRPYSLSL